MNEAHEAHVIEELSDEYTLLGELGRGGSAIVYRARDRALLRDVAIKVVRPRFAGSADEAIARLEREAQTVARLQHPHIVTVHAVKRLGDGGLALVMQLVPGRTLKQAIVDDGPFAPERAERVLREVAEALAFAHAHGVVHRDVKPENVFLDAASGRALLSDFGIAHSSEFDSRLTMDGAAIGTPAYMAPEQIDGAPANARSDLYSLGIVGWEMLTGEQPWNGDALYTVIYKQKHEPLPAIAALRPGQVPARLQYIVERMLQKRPAARWAGADGLLVALNAWVVPSDWAQWETSHRRRREREAHEPRAITGGPRLADAATVRFTRGDITPHATTAHPVAPQARPAALAAESIQADDEAPSWASEQAADDASRAPSVRRRTARPIVPMVLLLVAGTAATLWGLRVGPFSGVPGTASPGMSAGAEETAPDGIAPVSSSPDSSVPVSSVPADIAGNAATVVAAGTANRDTPNRKALVTSSSPASAPASATPAAPVALRLTPGNAVIYPGETLRLLPSLLFADGKTASPAELSWSSGNVDVVTVDASGRFTGVSPGTTVVFARGGALSAMASVTVRFPLVTQVEITPTDPVIERGGTIRLRATLRDAGGNTMASRPLTWSSSNDDVAIVSANGVVVGVAPGVATITVGADAVSATMSVIVR